MWGKINDLNFRESRTDAVPFRLVIVKEGNGVQSDVQLFGNFA